MNITELFNSHNMPSGALPVRCRVLDAKTAKILEDYMVQQLPECYITKADLTDRVQKTGLTASEILANKLPDPKHVISGDFGEILTLFFLSSERAEKTTLIKKWRYKQDRNKTTPHSDVVIIHRALPDKPSAKDFIICAETKQKATNNDSYVPIDDALKSLSDDRIGRLARTLLWLKEKAIDHGSRENIDYIRRFTEDISVEYSKYFKAVAIIDRDLLDEEITRKIEIPPPNDQFEVVVLGITKLKDLYESVFVRAKSEVRIA